MSFALSSIHFFFIVPVISFPQIICSYYSAWICSSCPFCVECFVPCFCLSTSYPFFKPLFKLLFWEGVSDCPWRNKCCSSVASLCLSYSICHILMSSVMCPWLCLTFTLWRWDWVLNHTFPTLPNTGLSQWLSKFPLNYTSVLQKTVIRGGKGLWLSILISVPGKYSLDFQACSSVFASWPPSRLMCPEGQLSSYHSHELGHTWESFMLLFI